MAGKSNTSFRWWTAHVIRAGGNLPSGLRKGETCFVRKHIVKATGIRKVLVLAHGNVAYITLDFARRSMVLLEPCSNEECIDINIEYVRTIKRSREFEKRQSAQKGSAAE